MRAVPPALAGLAVLAGACSSAPHEVAAGGEVVASARGRGPVEIRLDGCVAPGTAVAVSWLRPEESFEEDYHGATRALLDRARVVRQSPMALEGLPWTDAEVFAFTSNETVELGTELRFGPCVGSARLPAGAQRVAVRLSTPERGVAPDSSESAAGFMSQGSIVAAADFEGEQRVVGYAAGRPGAPVLVNLDGAGWEQPGWGDLVPDPNFGDLARFPPVAVAAAIREWGLDPAAMVIVARGDAAAGAVGVMRATGVRRVVFIDPRMVDPRLELLGPSPPGSVLGNSWDARFRYSALALAIGSSEPWANWSRLLRQPVPLTPQGLEEAQWREWNEAAPVTWLDEHAAEIVASVMYDRGGLAERLRRHGATIVELGEEPKLDDVLAAAPHTPASPPEDAELAAGPFGDRAPRGDVADDGP